jgi:putative transposase
VASFNGRMRQECLNANSFSSLDDAKGMIGAWRTYCSESRPHSRAKLGHLDPREAGSSCF